MCFDYKTFYLVQCFSTVFGIRLIFEMHKGMWLGYTFSRFHECFWHLAHFGNTHKHVARLYFFSFSHFFAFFGFKSFLAFCPFSKCLEACDPVIHFSRFMSVFGFLSMFEMHKGLWSGHIFLVFMRDLKKVIKVNFRSVVQLK